jgi:hypothetical protein
MGIATFAPIAMAKEMPANEQEKSDAMANHVACLAKNADLFDDQTSDAITIATATSNACRDTLMLVADVQSRGHGARVKFYARKRFLDGGPEIALPVILRLRASR